MSLHFFANFVTPYGTAANNRGENEGNVTTLQKLIWQGTPHTTVSAEAIRFALRRRLADAEEGGTNRYWDEDRRANAWKEDDFKGWASAAGATFIDDDLLGFMTTEAAKEEVEGSAKVRRAVLEVTRAVSLTPWPGDVTFNAASPGATPSAQKKGSNPVPYGTEMHATRFQYGVALTPTRLRDRSRAIKAVHALCDLGPVAGNHARFLFDFSPASVVFRVTDDPAPRLLYCFRSEDNGLSIAVPELLARVQAGDVDAHELILGGEVATGTDGQALRNLGAFVGERTGVRAAADEACRRMTARLEA